MHPSIIITSDFHFQDGAPKCRTDNYMEAVTKKVEALRKMQEKYQIPIVDAGDMFDSYEVSSEMESWVIKNLPSEVVTIPGNHDLKEHRIKAYEKSSLHVLECSEKIRVITNSLVSLQYNDFTLTGFPYGSSHRSTSVEPDKRKVAVVHTHVATSFPPGVEGYTPLELMEALQGYDLIISGHNHKPFSFSKGGRLLVNAGSMMRRTADEDSMRPYMWLWYAEDNHVEPIGYPIVEGVITREHITRKERNDERMDAYIEKIKSDQAAFSTSFEDNVKTYFSLHKVRSEVRSIVEEDALEQ